MFPVPEMGRSRRGLFDEADSRVLHRFAHAHHRATSEPRVAARLEQIQLRTRAPHHGHGVVGRVVVDDDVLELRSLDGVELVEKVERVL